MDVEHLVALISEVNNYMPCPLREEMLGPRKRKNEVHVLNALANILVSRASAEIVAVSIQLGNKSKKIMITLPTNNSMPDHICHHAMDVWVSCKLFPMNSEIFR